MVNGGRVTSWACINFSRNVQDSVARGFCHELAIMCQISGMVSHCPPNTILFFVKNTIVLQILFSYVMYLQFFVILCYFPVIFSFFPL
jgi:hypothetical protein